PKYSETTRATTARWYLEKQEKQIYGTQSMLAAKLESDGKGGQTATLFYANDVQFTQLLDKIGTAAGVEDYDPAELLEVSETGSQEADMAGGEIQECPAPVHTEELPHEHPVQEGLPQP